MPLGDLFKSKQELEAEQKKLQRRELRDATRSTERVQADLERHEKQLEKDIKTAAAKNDTDLVKVLAKQLVQVRNQKVRAVGAKSKISSIASHASTIETNNKLAQVMANSAAVMSKVGEQMKPEQLMNQMSQFQAETTKMDMKDEMMDDMFDELFEQDDEEADTLMNQVLEEIGLETGSALAQAPAASKASLSSKDSIASTSKQAVKKPTNH